MKKYDKYKPTGSPWIGEVPEHWELCRLKNYCSLKARIGWKGLRSDEFEDISYAYLVTGQDFDESEIDWSKCYQIAKERYEEDPYIQLNNGDLLITKDGTIGKIAKVTNLDKPACLNSGVFVMKHIKDKFFSDFLFWSLSSNLFKGYNSYTSTGTTILHLYQNVFENMPLLVPSLSEQKAIAKYLDEKCGSIDKIIATQEKRVALLNELKQSVISEAVTRGITPDAPIKDTGIEWIGQIPEHWEVKRLRFVCEFRNGYTPSKANPDFWEDGTIPWYRMEDIRDSGRYLNEAKQYVTEEAVKGAGLFEAGSFILATTATIGEHAMLIVDSLANQRFTNLKIRKSLAQALNKDFFFYYLYVIDDFCKSSTRTATFPAMNMEDLKNFGVTLPPIKEQEKIVEYLNAKTTSIDTLISKANKEIELLNEYKQLIISEAVTGKIKVC